MDPLIIRYLLKAKGMSLTDIARSQPSRSTKKPLSLASVCQVVDGKSRSRRIEKAVAKAVGLPLHEVFPDWYESDGSHVDTRTKSRMSTAEALARMRSTLDHLEAA